MTLIGEWIRIPSRLAYHADAGIIFKMLMNCTRETQLATHFPHIIYENVMLMDRFSRLIGNFILRIKRCELLWHISRDLTASISCQYRSLRLLNRNYFETINLNNLKN